MMLNMVYTVRFWDVNGNVITVSGARARHALTKDKAYAIIFAFGDEAMDKGAVTADIATEILKLHRAQAKAYLFFVGVAPTGALAVGATNFYYTRPK